MSITILIKFVDTKIYVCEDKFELNNQRRKPTLLAAPLYATNRLNFASKKNVQAKNDVFKGNFLYETLTTMKF